MSRYETLAVFRSERFHFVHVCISLSTRLSRRSRYRPDELFGSSDERKEVGDESLIATICGPVVSVESAVRRKVWQTKENSNGAGNCNVLSSTPIPSLDCYGDGTLALLLSPNYYRTAELRTWLLRKAAFNLHPFAFFFLGDH